MASDEVDNKFSLEALKRTIDHNFKQWEKMASEVRPKLEDALTEHYGERCLDFEKDCLCCKVWKALDDVLCNPYLE